jgi:hypothetical protein
MRTRRFELLRFKLSWRLHKIPSYSPHQLKLRDIPVILDTVAFVDTSFRLEEPAIVTCRDLTLSAPCMITQVPIVLDTYMPIVTFKFGFSVLIEYHH